MFKRRKKIKEKEISYLDWEKDFGFLERIISRKRAITENFFLNIKYSQHINKTDYLTDEDIEPIVSESVSSVIFSISEKYKNFLIKKYFGSIDNLIKYITEEFYISFAVDAINKNTKKIKENMKISNLEILNKINKKTKEK